MFAVWVNSSCYMVYGGYPTEMRKYAKFPSETSINFYIRLHGVSLHKKAIFYTKYH